MSIVISGVNNNDKITASDGTIDLLSGVTYNSEITVPSLKLGSNIQLGNAGIITATTFAGNISGTTGTFGDFVNIGSNIQLGNAGVVTATTFVGNVTGNVNNTGNLLLQIGGGEKVRITSTGRVGINSTNPSAPLEIYTAASAAWKFRIDTTVSDGAGFYQRSNGDFEMVLRDASNNVNYIAGTSGALQFATSGSERLRIDSGGRLLLGHTSSQDVYATSKLQIQGTTAATSSLSLLRHGNSPYLTLGSSGGSSLGDVTALSNGNRIGQITFAGADGTDVGTHAASMAAYVDGSVSSNTVPARISFQFGSSEAEKLRINSSGDILQTSSDRNYASWYSSPDNSSSNASISSDGNLTYSTAVIANTDVYNTSNGRYTAPVDGLYHIRANGLIDNNASAGGLYLRVKRNGSNYGPNIAYTTRKSEDSSSRYQILSGSAIVYMSASDYVTIYASAGMHASSECNFFAYLIRGTV